MPGVIKFEPGSSKSKRQATALPGRSPEHFLQMGVITAPLRPPGGIPRGSLRSGSESTGLPSRNPQRFTPALCLRPASSRLAGFGAAAFVLATLRVKAGGAEGIRTPDPHNAIVVLYQLSYDPNQSATR